MSLLFSLIVPFGSWRREELVCHLNQNPNGAEEIAGELLDEIEKMGAAGRILDNLVEMGLLVKVGKSRDPNLHYRLNVQEPESKE